MRPALLLALVLCCAAPATALAGTTENLGTDVAIALPVAAAGIAVWKDDWNGVADLGLTTLATVGTAYALKHLIREQRPDKSDFQSFPSDTTALAASGSSFLWARYGWSYGLPALAATGFVAFSRVDARQHHWYDTVASEALSIGYAALLTPRFMRRYNVYSSIDASPDGGTVHLAYRF